jgi:hypothetical protein
MIKLRGLSPSKDSVELCKRKSLIKQFVVIIGWGNLW